MSTTTQKNLLSAIKYDIGTIREYTTPNEPRILRSEKAKHPKYRAQLEKLAVEFEKAAGKTRKEYLTEANKILKSLTNELKKPYNEAGKTAMVKYARSSIHKMEQKTIALHQPLEKKYWKLVWTIDKDKETPSKKRCNQPKQRKSQPKKRK